MPTVDPEVAEEFAVVSAWLAALVPWSGTYHSMPEKASLLVAFRLPLVELQLRGTNIVVEGDRIEAEGLLAELFPGTHVVGDLYVATPPAAASFYTDSALVWGSTLWTLGALFIAGALVVSVGLYVRTGAITRRLPVAPVHAIGGLLAAATVAFAGASVLYFLARETVGIPVPVGVVIVGALAVVLLGSPRS